jgi:succinate dehydrogenase / fumarate reductase cytochrome b subunit
VKNDKRPINVGITDLLLFRWPIAALASISHRVAGVALFVGIALVLYALQMSLSSEQSFNNLKAVMTSSLIGMIITIGLLAALVFHFVAGIKHLLMDLGVGESLEGGAFAAKVVFLFSAALILLAALWVIQA